MLAQARRDPAYPVLTGSYNTTGYVKSVFVSGEYAYVCDRSFGLQILSLADRSHPVIVGSYSMPDSSQCLYVSNNYAFLTNGDLQIINISDPTNPTLAGNYVTPGTARDVFISGNYIYVADGFSLMILRFRPTGINQYDNLPNEFSLSQNYPNPFNAQTTIQYSLPKQSKVSIDIFDILGRKIGLLAEGIKPAGEYHVVWDATSQSSGIYFYRIKAGDKIETKKMVLMK